MKTVKAPAAGPVYSKSGYDVTSLSEARIAELAKRLKPDEANVILAKGTEPAFCGTLTDNKKEGTYICRLCGLPLFSSSAKFDSGTGWPSFFQPCYRALLLMLQTLSSSMLFDGEERSRTSSGGKRCSRRKPRGH